MATTLSNPPAEQAVPDPHKYPLRALKTILRTYLRLGGPAWLRLPSDFHPLAHVSFYLCFFITESYVSTLLCFLIPIFLLMTDRQLKRKKRAYGGKLYSNYMTEADLHQQPTDRDALQRLGTDTLFHVLGDELRLLVRLLRAAQQIFRRDPLGEEWHAAHHAAMVVLLRLAQISAVLRHRGSRFLPEECLRWQARKVWDELFAGAGAPKPVAKWLEPMQMKPWGPYRITIHLLHEQAAGRPIPAPFVERFPRWAEQLRSGQRVG
ncbi:MAG TPA: hypothetical protein VH540_15800 [Ktedonobacterales bacterium]|jgi:hypothetical protein